MNENLTSTRETEDITQQPEERYSNEVEGIYQQLPKELKDYIYAETATPGKARKFSESDFQSTQETRYKVVELIDAGSVGIVCKVRDEKLSGIDEDGVQVDVYRAAKFVPLEKKPETEEIERLQAEARKIAKLDHPNIVKVYDYLEDAEHDLGIMIQELVEGKSLKQLVKEGAVFNRSELMEVLGKLGSAIDYLNEQGCIHRDLSYNNILLTEDGPKIIDFELSALGSHIEAEGNTLTIAPETMEDGIADERSQMYSYAMVAQMAIYGNMLFNTLLEKPITPGSQTDYALRTIFDKALDIDPDKRYGKAEVLVHDIDLAFNRPEEVLNRTTA